MTSFGRILRSPAALLLALLPALIGDGGGAGLDSVWPPSSSGL
jgi:hypothetical protein